MHKLDLLALETIAKGSKSFSLAARFFPREQMINAARIYSWCRYCDDVIDEGEKEKTNLEQLIQETEKVWSNEKIVTTPFLLLRMAKESCFIPQLYALELLRGMHMDLQGTVYETFTELKLYCYRVASTVGLMMCHVMGLFRVSALEEAAKLGMAMQMTNIARDIKTDYDMGRVYLPLSWLRDEGLTRENYFESHNRTALFKVVRKLINESELLYEDGLKGIKDLPLKSALTILIAGKIYREIGREILRRGVISLDERVVVSKEQKMFLIFTAFITMLTLLPERLFSRKKLVPITETWVYP